MEAQQKVALCDWHIEVTLVQATLRRYHGQDAAAAYAARAPYDAVISADLRDGQVYLSAALATAPGMTRSDRRVIQMLLQSLGATSGSALRGQRMRDLPVDDARADSK